LHLSYEPRVKLVGNSVLEDTQHPFFWAGYMLIDTGTMPDADDADPTQRPVMQMQAGAGPAAGMRGAGGGQAAAAPPAGSVPAATADAPAGQPAGATPPETAPRQPVSQAFNPLLDDPADATRE
jgi:hypothetical protein